MKMIATPPSALYGKKAPIRNDNAKTIANKIGPPTNTANPIIQGDANINAAAIHSLPLPVRSFCKLSPSMAATSDCVDNSAVARKLLVRSFIMLRDQIDYAEFLRRGVAARSARETHGPNMPVL